MTPLHYHAPLRPSYSWILGSVLVSLLFQDNVMHLCNTQAIVYASLLCCSSTHYSKNALPTGKQCTPLVAESAILLDRESNVRFCQSTETCTPICYCRPHAEVNFTTEWRPIRSWRRGVYLLSFPPHSNLINLFMFCSAWRCFLYLSEVFADNGVIYRNKK